MRRLVHRWWGGHLPKSQDKHGDLGLGASDRYISEGKKETPRLPDTLCIPSMGFTMLDCLSASIVKVKIQEMG